MDSSGFSEALGAQILVPEPPLSDKGKAKVIDYFVVESELSKLVTSVETDFDWHGRPHFPVRIGLPASMHQVRILQFDTVPALSCELPEEECEVGASYVDWSELLERSEQLYFQLQGQAGGNKPLGVRRLLGVLYRYWAQQAEREVADRT